MTIPWIGKELDECPQCSSQRFASAGSRRDGARVSQCLNCDLGFLNPMPQEKDLERMYSDYFSREDGVGYSRYPRCPIITSLDHLLWDMVRRIQVSPSSSLDVGCAFGARVRFFEKKGLRAVGVDISEDAVSYGKKEWGLDLHACKFEDFTPKDKFDVVTMIDFVEHTLPDAWAPKLANLTHAGSLVLILTPDFDCYMEYKESWTGYNKSFEHIVFYNRKSLSELLRRNGFEILSSTNVKSQPTMPSEPNGAEPPLTPIRKAARFLTQFGPFRYLVVLRVNIMERLAWRGLSMDHPRQNSFLTIARRIS